MSIEAADIATVDGVANDVFLVDGECDTKELELPQPAVVDDAALLRPAAAQPAARLNPAGATPLAGPLRCGA